ncbi:MAG: TonB-dependent receptor [Flavobacteriales bacterium CG_4_9_14_0_2_um_filter_35_242]|nr:TonB-dependent receptor [Zetaproteobacteria bacterium]OIO10990.1 MAG: TonB-dependent receptor [Flavobacteriaceae bacterium CG1_02_35_72]PIR13798.1 MAG: TonB-dependent receptor [Flavobacteriales bacterium CG11_big_fil_rev_8_21_14_0_20_35_7]PJC59481.1 MAG: TonB-dependent receptor [Flavobacteriales bacterium CG_4_9_14_0_2_um_filter_35_242]
MKKLLICTLFLIQAVFSYSQSTTGVTGKIIDAKTLNPIESVDVSIKNTNLSQLTDASGKFNLFNVAVGNQMLIVKSNGYKDLLIQVKIAEGQILDLGDLSFEEDLTQEKLSGLITLSENDLTDDNSNTESTVGMLQATRDAFLQAAAYNFGQARFSVRGLDNKYALVMINGIAMNKVADGRPQYNDWGGLNDATRNQEFTNGSAPSDYTFGGIAGTQEINTRASIYRPGTRISFLNTNTNYSNRTMATHASGMNAKGWAYVVSAGRRWAQDGYYEGTDYAANSLFASVEKKLSDNHSLNFTAIYAQNKRGKNSPNTAELTDLAGVKYNSYWGTQVGEKRNSRIKETEEPLFMLTHFWKVNPKTNLNTTFSYQIGQIGNSRIDYTKADNPDPTYYRKLPSFFTNSFFNGVYTGNSPENIANAEATRVNFLENRQLNWGEIYRVNHENLTNGSRFVLYEDRNDENIATFNTILSSQISDNVLMIAGANYSQSLTKNFKNLLDLLGGTFFTDISTFGLTEDQQQSDLNNPFRIVAKNDAYGYNYNIHVKKLNAFTQFKFVYNKVDFYLAQTFSRSSYQREGFYKNGYYPTNSLGKSKKISFDNFGFKGGFTYKLTGRNYIDFNGIYMTKAPNAKDIFPNARVNNSITEGITNETIRGLDLSYIVKAPQFKTRITGYFSETLNATDINFYYADAVSNSGNGAFVSEVVTGINRKNLGIEAGVEYQLTATIKLTGVAAYGDYTITNNPNVRLSDDASSTVTDFGETKLAGLKQSGMPQKAYSIGIEYRDPKFWWISLNTNYLTDNYLDVSSIKRTDNFYTNIDNADLTIDQTLADSYLKQEKFNSFYLVNLVGGKTWRIKDKTLGLFATINNVFDITYKTGGFEQSRNATYRQEFEDHQSNGASVFAPKYFYGYGRTYMVNVYLTF